MRPYPVLLNTSRHRDFVEVFRSSTTRLFPTFSIGLPTKSPTVCLTGFVEREDIRKRASEVLQDLLLSLGAALSAPQQSHPNVPRKRK
jgi:hypothetical protein